MGTSWRYVFNQIEYGRSLDKPLVFNIRAKENYTTTKNNMHKTCSAENLYIQYKWGRMSWEHVKLHHCLWLHFSLEICYNGQVRH